MRPVDHDPLPVLDQPDPRLPIDTARPTMRRPVAPGSRVCAPSGYGGRDGSPPPRDHERLPPCSGIAARPADPAGEELLTSLPTAHADAVPAPRPRAGAAAEACPPPVENAGQALRLQPSIVLEVEDAPEHRRVGPVERSQRIPLHFVQRPGSGHRHRLALEVHYGDIEIIVSEAFAKPREKIDAKCSVRRTVADGRILTRKLDRVDGVDLGIRPQRVQRPLEAGDDCPASASRRDPGPRWLEQNRACRARPPPPPRTPPPRD